MRISLILLAYLSWCISALADQSLAEKIEAIIAKEGDLNIGIIFQNLDTNEILYERHPNRLFVPASITKLFTAYGALHYLGADYKFKTILSADNINLKDGILSSNVYIKFNGDPSLTKANLEEILGSLKQLGIKEINGDIIIDGSFFPGHEGSPGGFGWYDQTFCYGAPKTAIVIDNNCAESFVAVSTTNTPVKIKNYNEDILSISNKMHTGKKGENCPFESLYIGNNQYELFGCMPKEWEPVRLNFALQDNEKMIKDYITSILKKERIKIDGKITPGATSGKTILYEHQSKNLKELLKPILKDSSNIYAANVFKAMGAKYKNCEGTNANGIIALNNLLDREKISRKELEIHEGAGESGHNLVSPATLVSMLDHIHDDKVMHNHLSELLPAFKVEGTVKNRNVNHDNYKYIFAKTGSLKHTSTLAGYYLPPGKPQYAFAIMINNHLARHDVSKQLEDKLLELLIESESVKGNYPTKR
jgi:D-alanyl-D-alanine carboxypeptidase/D-alanyl-D-alanine-endopeptidase (penicillin-binding protein 4)